VKAPIVDNLNPKKLIEVLNDDIWRKSPKYVSGGQ
jgi:hypothetical protein